MNQIVAKHWTAKGTVSIEWTFVAGSWVFALTLDGRQIAIGTFADLLARDVATGALDDKLGFPAAKYAIPAAYQDWNQGRVPL